LFTRLKFEFYEKYDKAYTEFTIDIYMFFYGGRSSNKGWKFMAILRKPWRGELSRLPSV